MRTICILDNLMRLSDEELLTVLPYIRDENGEKVSLVELKHYLREMRMEKNEKRTRMDRRSD